MGRYKKDVKYWNKGGYWYYKTRDMSGYMSTGEKNKTKAEAVVAKLRQKNISRVTINNLQMKKAFTASFSTGRP